MPHLGVGRSRMGSKLIPSQYHNESQASGRTTNVVACGGNLQYRPKVNQMS